MTSADPTHASSIRAAFEHAAHVIDDWDRWPDDFVAFSASSPAVRHLFTRERQRVLETLRRHGPFESLNGLAAALGRDATRVSRDLDLLQEAGLVTTRRRGRRKRIERTGRPMVLF